jgi:hypothetical protein
VHGNIEQLYSRDHIKKIKKTVVAFLDCEDDDVEIDGFCHANSFFVILAIREKFLSKLFCMSQEDNEKLRGLNVDYYLIDEEKYTTETPHQGKNRIRIYLCKDILLI